MSNDNKKPTKIVRDDSREVKTTLKLHEDQLSKIKQEVENKMKQIEKSRPKSS